MTDTDAEFLAEVHRQWFGKNAGYISFGVCDYAAQPNLDIIYYKYKFYLLVKFKAYHPFT